MTAPVPAGPGQDDAGREALRAWLEKQATETPDDRATPYGKGWNAAMRAVIGRLASAPAPAETGEDGPRCLVCRKTEAEHGPPHGTYEDEMGVTLAAPAAPGDAGLRARVEALCDEADSRYTLPSYVLTADLRAALSADEAQS